MPEKSTAFLLNRRGFLAGLATVGAIELFDQTPVIAHATAYPMPATISSAVSGDVPDTDEQRIRDLITGNHILYDLDLVDGLGHLSVRSIKNPTHYFMSQSLAPGLVTRNDIIEFDQDSKPLAAC